ncbi:putative Dynein axonemal heavy chain 8 [Blattamonas nauphoetae]|uniref:Dynein axonemal heavy chain 8 n=1 Tax=Blattamonas nauphoetae TaxID=2049346 RepID=A0ABQ9YME3_9EUKA|nr:putative Dynein axonemal heavy chain 8 [Blattamonas nauphoetae]
MEKYLKELITLIGQLTPTDIPDQFLEQLELFCTGKTRRLTIQYTPNPPTTQTQDVFALHSAQKLLMFILNTSQDSDRLTLQDLVVFTTQSWKTVIYAINGPVSTLMARTLSFSPTKSEKEQRILLDTSSFTKTQLHLSLFSSTTIPLPTLPPNSFPPQRSYPQTFQEAFSIITHFNEAINQWNLILENIVALQPFQTETNSQTPLPSSIVVSPFVWLNYADSFPSIAPHTSEHLRKVHGQIIPDIQQLPPYWTKRFLRLQFLLNYTNDVHERMSTFISRFPSSVKTSNDDTIGETDSILNSIHSLGSSLRTSDHNLPQLVPFNKSKAEDYLSEAKVLSEFYNEILNEYFYDTEIPQLNTSRLRAFITTKFKSVKTSNPQNIREALLFFSIFLASCSNSSSIVGPVLSTFSKDKTTLQSLTLTRAEMEKKFRKSLPNRRGTVLDSLRIQPIAVAAKIKRSIDFNKEFIQLIKEFVVNENTAGLFEGYDPVYLSNAPQTRTIKTPTNLDSVSMVSSNSSSDSLQQKGSTQKKNTISDSFDDGEGTDQMDSTGALHSGPDGPKRSKSKTGADSTLIKKQRPSLFQTFLLPKSPLAHAFTMITECPTAFNNRFLSFLPFLEQMQAYGQVEFMSSQFHQKFYNRYITTYSHLLNFHRYLPIFDEDSFAKHLSAFNNRFASLDHLILSGMGMLIKNSTPIRSQFPLFSTKIYSLFPMRKSLQQSVISLMETEQQTYISMVSQFDHLLESADPLEMSSLSTKTRTSLKTTQDTAQPPSLKTMFTLRNLSPDVQKVFLAKQLFSVIKTRKIILEKTLPQINSDSSLQKHFQQISSSNEILETLTASTLRMVSTIQKRLHSSVRFLSSFFRNELVLTIVDPTTVTQRPASSNSTDKYHRMLLSLDKSLTRSIVPHRSSARSANAAQEDNYLNQFSIKNTQAYVSFGLKDVAININPRILASVIQVRQILANYHILIVPGMKAVHFPDELSTILAECNRFPNILDTFSQILRLRQKLYMEMHPRLVPLFSIEASIFELVLLKAAQSLKWSSPSLSTTVHTLMYYLERTESILKNSSLILSACDTLILETSRFRFFGHPDKFDLMILAEYTEEMKQQIQTSIMNLNQMSSYLQTLLELLFSTLAGDLNAFYILQIELTEYRRNEFQQRETTTLPINQDQSERDDGDDWKSNDITSHPLFLSFVSNDPLLHERYSHLAAASPLMPTLRHLYGVTSSQPVFTTEQLLNWKHNQAIGDDSRGFDTNEGDFDHNIFLFHPFFGDSKVFSDLKTAFHRLFLYYSQLFTEAVHHVVLESLKGLNRSFKPEVGKRLTSTDSLVAAVMIDTFFTVPKFSYSPTFVSVQKAVSLYITTLIEGLSEIPQWNDSELVKSWIIVRRSSHPHQSMSKYHTQTTSTLLFNKVQTAPFAEEVAPDEESVRSETSFQYPFDFAEIDDNPSNQSDISEYEDDDYIVPDDTNTHNRFSPEKRIALMNQKISLDILNELGYEISYDGQVTQVPETPYTIPGQMGMGPSDTPSNGMNMSLWDAISSSQSVLIQALEVISIIPSETEFIKATQERFSILSFLFQYNPSSLCDEMSYLKNKPFHQRDLPTFALPSSFELTPEADVPITSTTSKLRNTFWNGYRYVVVNRPIPPVDESPSTFIPDELPYTCPFDGKEFPSLVSVTNHIHAAHQNINQSEKQLAFASLQRHYISRSLERLQLWEQALGIAKMNNQKKIIEWAETNGMLVVQPEPEEDSDGVVAAIHDDDTAPISLTDMNLQGTALSVPSFLSQRESLLALPTHGLQGMASFSSMSSRASTVSANSQTHLPSRLSTFALANSSQPEQNVINAFSGMPVRSTQANSIMFAQGEYSLHKKKTYSNQPRTEKLVVNKPNEVSMRSVQFSPIPDQLVQVLQSIIEHMYLSESVVLSFDFAFESICEQLRHWQEIFCDRLKAEVNILLQFLEVELGFITQNISGTIETIDDLRKLQKAFEGFGDKSNSLELLLNECKLQVDVLLSTRDEEENKTVITSHKKCHDVYDAMLQRRRRYNQSLEYNKSHLSNALLRTQESFLSGLQWLIGDVKNALEILQDPAQDPKTQFKMASRYLVQVDDKIGTLADLNEDEQFLKMELTVSEQLFQLKPQLYYVKELYRLYIEFTEWKVVFRETLFEDIKLDEIEEKLNSYMSRLMMLEHSSPPHPMKLIIETEINKIVNLQTVFSLIDPKQMKPRHWRTVGENAHLSEFVINPYPTLGDILDSDLLEKKEVFIKCISQATGEARIETDLRLIETLWNREIFIEFESKGSHKLVDTDSCTRVIDEAESSLLALSQLATAQYSQCHLPRILNWSKKLAPLQNLAKLLISTQQSYWRLKGLFSSEEVSRSLPIDSKNFSILIRDWTQLMAKIKEQPLAVICLSQGEYVASALPQIHNNLMELNTTVVPYLRTVQEGYPRLYLLSEDNLISMISFTDKGDDLTDVIHKFYPNIVSLDFATSGNSQLFTKQDSQDNSEDDDSHEGSDAESHSHFSFEIQHHSDAESESNLSSSYRSVLPTERRSSAQSSWDVSSQDESQLDGIQKRIRHQSRQASAKSDSSDDEDDNFVIQLTNKNQKKPRNSHVSQISGISFTNTKQSSIVSTMSSSIDSQRASAVEDFVERGNAALTITGFGGLLNERVQFKTPLRFRPGKDYSSFFALFEREMKESVSGMLLHSLIDFVGVMCHPQNESEQVPSSRAPYDLMDNESIEHQEQSEDMIREKFEMLQKDPSENVNMVTLLAIHPSTLDWNLMDELRHLLILLSSSLITSNNESFAAFIETTPAQGLTFAINAFLSYQVYSILIEIYEQDWKDYLTTLDENKKPQPVHHKQSEPDDWLAVTIHLTQKLFRNITLMLQRFLWKEISALNRLKLEQLCFTVTSLLTYLEHLAASRFNVLVFMSMYMSFPFYHLSLTNISISMMNRIIGTHLNSGVPINRNLINQHNPLLPFSFAGSDKPPVTSQKDIDSIVGDQVIPYGNEFLGLSLSSLQCPAFFSYRTPYARKRDEASQYQRFTSLTHQRYSIVKTAASLQTPIVRSFHRPLSVVIKEFSVIPHDSGFYSNDGVSSAITPSAMQNSIQFPLFQYDNLIQSEELITELAYFSGQSLHVFHGIYDSTPAHALSRFISGIVGSGLWGLISQINQLPPSAVQNLANVLNTLRVARLNEQSHVTLSERIRCPISSSYGLFFSASESTHTTLPPTLRASFRPFNQGHNRYPSIIASQLIMNGFRFAFPLTETIINFIEAFANGTETHESQYTSTISFILKEGFHVFGKVLNRYFFSLLPAAYSAKAQNTGFSSFIKEELFRLSEMRVPTPPETPSSDDDTTLNMTYKIINEEGDTNVLVTALQHDYLIYIAEKLTLAHLLYIELKRVSQPDHHNLLESLIEIYFPQIAEYVLPLSDDEADEETPLLRLEEEYLASTQTEQSCEAKITSLALHLSAALIVPQSHQSSSSHHSSLLDSHSSTKLINPFVPVSTSRYVRFQLTHYASKTHISESHPLFLNANTFSNHIKRTDLKAMFSQTSFDQSLPMSASGKVSESWKTNPTRPGNSSTDAFLTSIFPDTRSASLSAGICLQPDEFLTAAPVFRRQKSIPKKKKEVIHKRHVTKLKKSKKTGQVEKNTQSRPEPLDIPLTGPDVEVIDWIRPHIAADLLTPGEIVKHFSIGNSDLLKQCYSSASLVLQLYRLMQNPFYLSPVNQHRMPQFSPVVVVGPTGSGKSTLVNMLANIQTLTGAPTRVIRLTANSFTLAQLLGTFSACDDTDLLSPFTSDPNTEIWSPGLIPLLLDELGAQYKTPEQQRAKLISQAKSRHRRFTKRADGIILPYDEVNNDQTQSDPMPAYETMDITHSQRDINPGYVNQSSGSISEDPSQPLLEESNHDEIFLVLDVTGGYTNVPDSLASELPAFDRPMSTELQHIPTKHPQTSHQAWANSMSYLLRDGTRLESALAEEFVRRSEKLTLFDSDSVSSSEQLFEMIVGIRYPYSFSDVIIQREMKRMEALKSANVFFRSDDDDKEESFGQSGWSPKQKPKAPHLADLREFTSLEMGSLMKHLETAFIQSHQLILPNLKSTSLHPRVHLIIETDSLSVLPQSVIRTVRPLYVPRALFKDQFEILSIRELHPEGFVGANIFNYIYRRISTNFIQVSHLLGEVTNKFMHSIYEELTYVAGLLTFWTIEATGWVQSFFKTQNVQQMPEPTKSGIGQTSSSMATSLMGAQGMYVNQSLQKANSRNEYHYKLLSYSTIENIISLYSTLIKLIITTMESRFASNRTRHKSIAPPIDQPTKLNGIGTDTEISTRIEMDDRRSIMARAAVYSVVWGLGGGLAIDPMFANPFSQFIINLTQYTPDSSALRNPSLDIQATPSDIIHEDVQNTAKYFRDESVPVVVAKETVFDYGVSFKTGEWFNINQYIETTRSIYKEIIQNKFEFTQQQEQILPKPVIRIDPNDNFDTDRITEKQFSTQLGTSSISEDRQHAPQLLPSPSTTAIPDVSPLYSVWQSYAPILHFITISIRTGRSTLLVYQNDFVIKQLLPLIPHIPFTMNDEGHKGGGRILLTDCLVTSQASPQVIWRQLNHAEQALRQELVQIKQTTSVADQQQFSRSGVRISSSDFQESKSSAFKTGSRPSTISDDSFGPNPFTRTSISSVGSNSDSIKPQPRTDQYKQISEEGQSAHNQTVGFFFFQLVPPISTSCFEIVRSLVDQAKASLKQSFLLLDNPPFTRSVTLASSDASSRSMSDCGTESGNSPPLHYF